MMTRSRVITLLIHQEEKTSASNSPFYFSNLEQVSRDRITVTFNNVVKSIRFEPFVGELSFQNS